MAENILNIGKLGPPPASEDFQSNIYWTKDALFCTQNSYTAPDGTMTMEKLVPQASFSNHTFKFRDIIGLTEGVVYTISIFAKDAGNGRISFYSFDSGDFFDFVFGTESFIDSVSTVGFQRFGDGIYRIWQTFTMHVGGQVTNLPEFGFNRQTFTGDGVSGLYVWGAKLNVGGIDRYEAASGWISPLEFDESVSFGISGDQSETQDSTEFIDYTSESLSVSHNQLDSMHAERVLETPNFGFYLSYSIWSETNYSFYDEILQKMLDAFTPELRYQYEDSKIFRAIVESFASELGKAKNNLLKSVKELNVQKAKSLFLELWQDVVGLQKKYIDINGVKTLETDIEYGKRIVDNIFLDKVSNQAITRYLMKKYEQEFAIKDLGITNYTVDTGTYTLPDIFKDNILYSTFKADNGKFRAKHLSNLINIEVLGGSQLDPSILSEIWEEVANLSAIGTVVSAILEDLVVPVSDVPMYGGIYFGDITYNGTEETQILDDIVIYLDNQIKFGDNKVFSYNSTPDDIVVVEGPEGLH